MHFANLHSFTFSKLASFMSNYINLYFTEKSVNLNNRPSCWGVSFVQQVVFGVYEALCHDCSIVLPIFAWSRHEGYPFWHIRTYISDQPKLRTQILIDIWNVKIGCVLYEKDVIATKVLAFWLVHFQSVASYTVLFSVAIAPQIVVPVFALFSITLL